MGHKKLGAEVDSEWPTPMERHRNPGVHLGGQVPHTAIGFSADPNATILGQASEEKKTQRTRKLAEGGGGSESLGSVWVPQSPLCS